MNDRRPDLHAVRRATAQRPQAPRPQLMMVRGGGSAAPRMAEAGPVASVGANSGFAALAGLVNTDIFGTIAPGQTAAHSGAQFTLQQPISSWLAMPDGAVSIGQSGDGTAKAGPDAAARERASQIKRSRRRIAIG